MVSMNSMLECFKKGLIPPCFQPRLLESQKIIRCLKRRAILIGAYSDYSYRGLFCSNVSFGFIFSVLRFNYLLYFLGDKFTLVLQTFVLVFAYGNLLKLLLCFGAYTLVIFLLHSHSTKVKPQCKRLLAFLKSTVR